MQEPNYHLDLVSFSSRSLASFILLARYGDPPRSGWFASMICRCASLSCFFSAPPSLHARPCKQKSNPHPKQYETHLRPRIARASFRSIFALKPPLTHCSAAFFPPKRPLRMSERPATAAAIAPKPMMMGVDMIGRGEKRNTKRSGGPSVSTRSRGSAR